MTGPAGRFPDHKRFAFTIIDDTDSATVAAVAPVYDLLARLGLRTTKTVWTLAPTRPVRIGGATLADPEYCDFILKLRDQGFEIASHGATSHGVPRDENARFLETFKDLIGDYPKVHCNHSMNVDNLYWGAARFSSRLHRFVYRAANLTKDRRFEGHLPGSPYFWADLARQHIPYVRNFVFYETNLLNVFPRILYHDPAKPLVNFWFISTQAPGLPEMLRAISPENQDRLEREGGICILYTHFGAGFVDSGMVNPDFRRLLERLAARPGWFVPAGHLLDHLRTRGAGEDISRRDLIALERRWLLGKFSHRRRRTPSEGVSMTGG